MSPVQPVDDPSASQREPNPFAPPTEPEAPAWTPQGDLHVTLTRALLWLVFGGWLLLVAFSFPLYISIANEEAQAGSDLSPTLQGIVMALVVDAVFAPPAILGLVANIGLRKGRRWAYVATLLALVVLLLYCLPIGLYGLWAMLRNKVGLYFHPRTS